MNDVNLYNLKRKIRIFIHRKSAKIGIILGILGVFSVIFMLKTSFILPDTVKQLGEAELSKLLFSSMNEAVGDYLEKNGEVQLYDIKRGEDGTVLSVDMRGPSAAAVKQQLTAKTLSIIEEKDAMLSVPVGSLFDSSLFSGRGGNLSIRLLSVPYVESEIISEFKQAGINQTEHTVKVRLTCSVSALAGEEKFEVCCSDDMILSKTLIVGKIPSSYTQLGVYDEGTKKWLYSNRG